MGFWHVAAQMVVVSLPILVGWAARKLDMMDDAFDAQLSKLTLNIGLPSMIVASVATSSGLPGASDLVQALVAAIVLSVIAVAAGYLVTALMRVPASSEGVYRFIVTFGNCSFIGFPVISAIYGSEALVIAAIGLIPFNFLMFIFGVMMFTGPKDGVRGWLRGVAACFKTPPLLASIVVLACVLTGFRSFGVVGDALEILGRLTIPAALLLMGSSMAKFEPLSMLSNWRAYIAVAGRLLLVPLAGIAILRLMGIDASVLAIVTLEMAMPVATNGTLYCLQYGVDVKPMMQGTFLSIVLSIVSIPLIVTIMGA